MDWLIIYFLWWAASRVWGILGILWLDKKLSPQREPRVGLEELIWFALPFFLEASVVVVLAALAAFAFVYGVLYLLISGYAALWNYIERNTSSTKR